MHSSRMRTARTLTVGGGFLKEIMGEKFEKKKFELKKFELKTIRIKKNLN